MTRNIMFLFLRTVSKQLLSIVKIVLFFVLDKEVFEGTKSLTDAYSLIHQLYSSLHVDKYQV